MGMTLCATGGRLVDNQGFSTVAKNTSLQDVFDNRTPCDVIRHVLSRFAHHRPQFTALITVISSLYKYAQITMEPR